METNDDAVRMIARLARVFETRLGEESMTLPQFRVLSLLSEGEWAASVLADCLAVSRPSITGIVDALVERGWVERHDSPTDRRRVLHQLTAAGRQALATSTASLDGTLDKLLDHLDESERARALDGLAQLGVALRRHLQVVAS